MSFSVTIPDTDGEHINEAIDAVQLPEGVRTPEHEAQLAAGKEAAKALVASGALAGAGEPASFIYRGSIGGHANTDYAYGGFVSVQLSGTPKPAPVAEVAE